MRKIYMLLIAVALVFAVACGSSSSKHAAVVKEYVEANEALLKAYEPEKIDMTTVTAATQRVVAASQAASQLPEAELTTSETQAMAAIQEKLVAAASMMQEKAAAATAEQAAATEEAPAAEEETAEE